MAAAPRPEALRFIEALLFAAAAPLDEQTLAERLPEGVDVQAAMRALQAEYASRGVNLVRVAGKWSFRTAKDLAWLMAREAIEQKTPGRPITFGTTEAFLSHFGLESVGDLPGLEELRSAGLMDGQLPPGFSVPVPSDEPALREDEDPLEPGDLDLGLAPRPTETPEE